MTDPDEPLLTWDYHMLWHDDLHCETLNRATSHLVYLRLTGQNQSFSRPSEANPGAGKDIKIWGKPSSK